MTAGIRIRTIAWAALALAGCSHPRFDGRVYQSDTLAFRVGALPPSWKPLETADDRVSLRDASADTLITVGGRCGLDGDDVPLTALTQHLFLYFTERQQLNQRKLQLDGREALRTELTAKLDGVPRSFVVYVLKKDGCVYDLIRIAPPDGSPSTLPQFEQWVSEFTTRWSDG